MYVFAIFHASKILAYCHFLDLTDVTDSMLTEEILLYRTIGACVQEFTINKLIIHHMIIKEKSIKLFCLKLF